jgi:hypothetical protein
MKLRIAALLFGVLSCAGAWCQSSTSDSAKPASSSSTKCAASAAKAEASAEPPANVNIAPDFVLDDLHLFPSAADSCPKGTTLCTGQKKGQSSCCSENQDCFNCDGTCHPKGTVKRSC